MVLSLFSVNPDPVVDWPERAICGSFREFVQVYETAVFTFCYRLLGDAATAECVAAAAFQEIHAHFPAVSLVDVLAAARRCCLVQQQTGRVCGANTAVNDIQYLFDQLPMSEREVMALRYGCKLNFAEMAAVLNTSCETVRAALRQGRWHVANLAQIRLAGQN